MIGANCYTLTLYSTGFHACLILSHDQILQKYPSWIVYDSRMNPDDYLDGFLLILATESGLLRVGSADTLICDGTFRKCPALFNQMVMENDVILVQAFIDVSSLLYKRVYPSVRP